MIRLDHLEKRYGTGNACVHAVKDTSLSLPKQGLVALFGHSGCGKTTLLNLIGGLDRAQKGTITLQDQIVTPNSTEVRNRQIGYIFQNYNLLKELTVYENVALSLRLCGVTDEAEIQSRTMAALQSVEMEKYRRRLPVSLSGGQQQRVAIARALVKNPAVILADEPTGNLDEQNTLLVMDLLKEVSRQHLVLLVTHEADLVEYYCDRVIEISDGAVKEDRTNVARDYHGISAREVYLGDLPHVTHTFDQGQIDCYGEVPAQALQLKLIAVHGNLYLQADPSLRLRFVQDTTAEIHLHEGKAESAKREQKEIDPLLLTPPTVKGPTGRATRTKKAFLSGIQKHFLQKKKGKRLLLATLCLFALLLPFLVAYFGQGLAMTEQLQASYPKQNVIVQTEAIADRAVLQQILTAGKVDSVYALPRYYAPDDTSQQQTFSFSLGNFETISHTNRDFSMSLSLPATPLHADALPAENLVCGHAPTAQNEVVLSSSLADRLLKEAGVDYLHEYRDLLYLRVSSDIDDYYNISSSADQSHVIVGIAEEADYALYFSPTSFYTYQLIQQRKERAFGALPAVLREAMTELGYPPVDSVLYSPHSQAANGPVTLNGVTYSVVDLPSELYSHSDPAVQYAISNAVPEYFCTESALSSLFLDLCLAKEENTSPNLWQILQNYKDYYSDQTPIPALSLHSADLPALLTALTALDAEKVDTPDEQFQALRSSHNASLFAKGIVLCVILGVLSLCLYFILRASMMSSIREIGILRAIGVSRANLLFSSLCETLVLFAGTVFFGFALSSWALRWLLSSVALLQNFLYYPLWMCGLLFAFLLLLCCVCGLLPKILLLRKTPAQILTKYDI